MMFPDGLCGCFTCGSDKVEPEDFKDDVSRQEFGISRMCQSCQDETFGPCDEDCGHEE